MIDFTKCEELINNYLGKKKKKRIVYNNEIYLLKFPDSFRENNNSLSYVNNQFAEYIGCHIFKELGITVQETQLGIYCEKNKNKVCVACRDFENDGMQLYEFAKLANSVTNSSHKFATRIEDVYEVIKKAYVIKDKQSIIDGFWDIFVVDCLIGNTNRNLNNWGVVQNINSEITIAPVYDCGSSLFPLITEKNASELLNDLAEMENISYNVKSIYKMNDKPIFYRDIGIINNNDFKNALFRIGNRIDLEKIEVIIDNTPYLSSIYKKFYMTSIKIRYDLILKEQIKRISIEKEGANL
ncbi:MAG: HipA domain-containing protein [Terrisporobacter sp.]